MASALGERAVIDAFEYRKALLKFISPNDAGLTGAHQCGYYLPKPAWQVFTDIPPEPGQNADATVEVLWQDGRATKSRIVWYGASKHEYRMTRFGKDFPFLNPDTVGNLLVLIPKGGRGFNAYVLDLEDDIEEIQAALGVEVTGPWAVYVADRRQEVEETPDECIERHFREFVAQVDDFPKGEAFSETTLTALRNCIREFSRLPADDRLVRCMQEEYRLFRLVERKICQPDICRMFKDVDDFLKTAHSLLNRRKSRAGRSLENHVAILLDEAKIPFDVRPANITGEPDIVIQGEDSPEEELTVVGVKNTCKDRWRQVLEEAPEAKTRYILTLQRGISNRQLRQMHKAGVKLIVPDGVQEMYPPDRDVPLLTVEAFIAQVRHSLERPA